MSMLFDILLRCSRECRGLVAFRGRSQFEQQLFSDAGHRTTHRQLLIRNLRHLMSLIVGCGVLMFGNAGYAASTYTSPAIKWHIDAPLSDSAEASCKKKIVDAGHTWLDFHHLQSNPIYNGSSSYPLGGYDCYVQDNSDSPPTVKFYRTTASGYVCTDPAHNLVSPSYLCEISAGGIDRAKQQCDRDPDCASQSPVRDLPNPINPATGNKYLVEVDYVGAGLFPLHFRRYYNSRPPDLGSLPGSIGAFGRHWRGSFDRYVYIDATSQQSATVSRPSGNSFAYRLTGSNVWTPDPDVTAVLERLFSGSTPTGWRYVDPRDDTVENYDASGRLVSIANRSGVTLTLTYFSSGANSGLLEKVSDSFGRELVFGYDSQRRITSMVNPVGSSGGTFTYSYDSNGNLQSVTFPDSSVRTYRYEDSSFPSFVTGVTDENSAVHTTYTYDSQGRALSSERAGQAERVTVSYPSSTSAEVVSYVSASSSATRTYQYSTINGINRPIAITGAVCPTCGPAALSHDATTGFLTSKTDWNNNKTCYVRDARGLETSRVEGLGTSANCASLPSLSGVQRKISTEWHATFRLVKKLAEPKRLTTFVFNGEGTNCGPGGASIPAGLICSKTLQATTDTNGSAGLTPTVTGTARTWTYTYNAEGQVLTENGPRTDVSDFTTYTYFANNATCTATVSGASTTGCRGQVNTITNAVGHVTTFNEYSAHGQPLKITDPNGLVTVLAYDARMRLTSKNVGGEVSAYEYWPTGLLKKAANPDGSFLRYTYDDAHRLIQIEDSITSTPNKIVYTLDAMGNRIKEEVFDQSGSLAQRVEREYNSVNRLVKVRGGTNPSTQVTEYVYDNQGNVTRMTMPLVNLVTAPIDTVNTRSYDYTYDALNRQTSVTEPPKDNQTGTPRGVISHQFDLLDQLTQVTDPRGLVTTYTVDGLANRTQQVSPDTGTMTMTYDAAGNLLTKTDARGSVVANTYDSLNRVTQLVYSDQTITYTYDAGQSSKGRLTAVSDRSGSTEWSHDLQGRSVWKKQTIYDDYQSTTPRVLITEYGYDTNGRMIAMKYPTGRQLSYGFDQAGRVTNISLDSVALLSSISYHPFGPPSGWTFAGTQSYSRTFDLDGRLSSHPTAPGVVRTLLYDAASRVAGMSHVGASGLDQIFTYDNLDRVTGWVHATNSYGYEYDVTGNRTTLRIGSNTHTNTYSSTGNQILGVSGPTLTSYIHDAAGNRTSDGIWTTTYGQDGRIQQQVRSGYPTVYSRVNALGQRVVKFAGPNSYSLFSYDEAGRLTGEYEPTTTAQFSENVYLGDLLVAHLRPPENVIDNDSSMVTVVGTWSTVSNGTGFAGSNFRTRAAGTGAGTFRWKLQYLSTGSHRVYARWVAGSDRATNAKFRVVHSGGTTDVTVNQQHDGGEWILLGSFTFTFNNSAQGVTLSDDANGVVVADAVKAVQENVAPYIYHVHADHTGTPRTLVVANGTSASWRWDTTDPFGSIGPSVSAVDFRMRFPGQYADVEGTGLFYNYFRDYDPAIGRYIQSDPIGLEGGINTYAYVGSNPLSYVDPFGLEVQICCRPDQITGGILNHCWVKTDTKAAGMGANPNIPPGTQWEGYGMRVQITDHSKDTPTQCTPQKNVDEQCVNDKLQVGKPIGRFIPPFNQCQSFAYGVVNSCRTGPQWTPRP